MTFTFIPVKTGYLKAGEGYDNLADSITSVCEDGDYVFISETPVSTVEGNLVDESNYDAGIISILITEVWCRYLWGYLLCPLLGISERTTHNLRNMPIEARSHKEFIYREYGLKHALQPTAEAGVDLSNVPDKFVSLLPEKPQKSAQNIKEEVFDRSGKKVEIIIIDTDPTYKIGNTYFTTLPKSVDGVVCDTGVFGFVLRVFSQKKGATILASTADMDIDKLIELANSCEDCQQKSSTDFFETVYNMKDKFGSEYSNVSVDMLSSVCHIPAVIVRKDKYL